VFAQDTALNVTAGSLNLGGSINDSAAKTLTKTGAGALILTGSQTYGSGSSLLVNNGRVNMNSSPGTNLSATVGGAAASLVIGSSATVGSVAVNAGTAGIVAAGASNVIAPQAALEAGGGDPTGYVPGDKYVITNKLSVASGGHLDINDGILVVNDITANGGDQNTLNTLVQHGNPRSTGALGNYHPNQGEILSTTANDDYNNFLGATSVGWVDNFDTGYKNINSSNGLLKTGTLITPPSDNGIQYIFKYVYAGDTNLDGKVNNTDLQNLVANYNQTTNGNTGNPVAWFDGDFNGDGIVDSKDLAILVGNYNSGTVGSSFGPLLPGTSVPEPSSVVLMLLGLAGTAALVRRKK